MGSVSQPNNQVTKLVLRQQREWVGGVRKMVILAEVQYQRVMTYRSVQNLFFT